MPWRYLVRQLSKVARRCHVRMIATKTFVRLGTVSCTTAVGVLTGMYLLAAKPKVLFSRMEGLY